MRGQMFLIAIIVIIFAIAQLQNSYNYSELPALTEETFFTDAGSVATNVASELVFVVQNDPLNCTRINNFLGYVNAYSQERGYEVYVEGCSW